MDNKPEQIKKSDRVHVTSDADQRKEEIRQLAEDKGHAPEEASALAEELQDKELPEEWIADRLGEKMAEDFIKGAVEGDPKEPDVPPADAIVTSTREEVAWGTNGIPDEVEPAPEPSPMREPD